MLSFCDIICDSEQCVTMATGTDGGSNMAAAAPKLVPDGSSGVFETEYQGHVNNSNNYNENNPNY